MVAREFLLPPSSRFHVSRVHVSRLHAGTSPATSNRPYAHATAGTLATAAPISNPAANPTAAISDPLILNRMNPDNPTIAPTAKSTAPFAKNTRICRPYP